MPRLESLRSGAWLNARRLRVYPWLFLILFLGAAVVFLASAKDGRDGQGRPIGTDFLNVWAASVLVLAGEPAAVYDVARHRAVERQALGGPPIEPYYGWHYPPLALLPIAPLALLPYGGALALWLGATFPLALWALWPILPKPVPWAAVLGFPALFVNLAHGQNGFLTTALLGGGLVQLARRPALAGILFGLLAYKPQFGLLVPLALAAGGCWRAFGAASATVAAFVGLSLAGFGFEPWRAFLENLPQTGGAVMAAIGPAKLQSVWAAARLLGAGPNLALAVQAGASLAAAWLVWRLWRGESPLALKSAGLVLGGLLATPYVLDYDLVILAIPILFLLPNVQNTRFEPWSKTALAALWLLPILARPLAMAHLPLVVPALALVLWRAARPPKGQ
jgi:alpha-1,2-mannosyltransferase